MRYSVCKILLYPKAGFWILWLFRCFEVSKALQFAPAMPCNWHLDLLEPSTSSAILKGRSAFISEPIVAVFVFSLVFLFSLILDILFSAFAICQFYNVFWFVLSSQMALLASRHRHSFWLSWVLSLHPLSSIYSLVSAKLWSVCLFLRFGFLIFAVSTAAGYG